MAPTTKAKTQAEKPAKKTKSTGGSKGKKLTNFNKHMKTEMARLKEEEPQLSHKERFKMATETWATSSKNPKNAS